MMQAELSFRDKYQKSLWTQKKSWNEIVTDTKKCFLNL